jgi:hypothetical protein
MCLFCEDVTVDYGIKGRIVKTPVKEMVISSIKTSLELNYG